MLTAVKLRIDAAADNISAKLDILHRARPPDQNPAYFDTVSYGTHSSRKMTSEMARLTRNDDVTLRAFLLAIRANTTRLLPMIPMRKASPYVILVGQKARSSVHELCTASKSSM